MNTVMHTNMERRAIPTGMRTNIRMAIPMQSPVTMGMDTQATMDLMSIGISNESQIPSR
jgi:hypothetical protein